MRRRLSRVVPALRGRESTLRTGQLDNQDLESVVAGIIDLENWDGERQRLVVEVGTGGGRGSTVAIHRALGGRSFPFELIGYEGDPDLAALASRHWDEAPNVNVVNEYFMHRADLETAVKSRVAPSDRDAYLPEFEAVGKQQNFLVTPPPGPVDLLFIDSVRYTHLAILRAAVQWLAPDTVVVMEDDIPGYGELAIVEGEFDLRDITKHEIAGHPWPLVEFKLALESRHGR